VIIPVEQVRKNKYMLEKILTTFNSFFQGKAEAKIVARGKRRSIYGFVIVPLRYA
jgi:hypothetical protein